MLTLSYINDFLFTEIFLRYIQFKQVYRIIFFYFRLEANGGDDQYDDYGPQQKNDIHLAEGEDEGEGNLRNNRIIRSRN